MATRYEENSAFIKAVGVWTRFSSGSSSDGYASYSDAGCVEIIFRGTGIVIGCVKGAGAGIADIELDGAVVASPDLYNDGWLYQQDVYTVSGLVDKIHRLRFHWTGTKNASSSGDRLYLDYFDVTGVAQAVYPPGAGKLLATGVL